MPTIDDLRRASGAYAQGRSDIELIDEYARLNKLSPLDAVRELNYTPLQSDNGKWGNRLGGAIDSYQGNWYGLGEALFGSQGLKRRRVENEFEAAVAREAAANQGAVSSYKDVGGVGDALDYVGGLAVDSLPYLGEAVAGGLATRGATSLFSAGRGLKAAIDAGRATNATVDAVRAGQAAQRALGTRMALGGAVASYPSAVGDILANQREANPDGPVDLTSAAIGGVPYAALNMLGVEGMVARGGLGRGLSSLDDAARLGKTKRFGAAVGMGSAVEGASETGQEVINQYFGRMAVSPNEELFSPEAVDRYGESFVGGAALGGAFSGMGGWRKSQEYQNNQELQAAVLRETNMRAQQEQQEQAPKDLLRIGYEPPTMFVNPAGGADTSLDAATLRFNDGLDNAPRATGGLPVTAPVRYNAQTEMFGEQSSVPGAQPVESVEELQLRRQELDRELNALQGMYAQAEREFQQTGDQAKWFRSRAILMSHLEKLAPVKQDLDARLDRINIGTPDTGVPVSQGRFLFDDPVTSWQTTDTTEADKRDARAAAPDYFKGPKAGGRAKTMNAIIGDANPEGVATRIAERWAAANNDETKRELADNLAAWYSAFTGKSLVKEAPANVSVPDASGLGVGSSGVQGSPVAGGSVEAAGRVPATADGVPAAPASVPADPAQAAAVGDEVRGAGTAPLTEKPAESAAFGATREDRQNNLLVDRTVGGYRVQLVGTKNLGIDLAGVPLSDLPVDVTSATAATAEEARAQLEAKLRAAASKLASEKVAKELASVSRERADGKTVVDIDKLTKKLNDLKLDPRLKNAVLFYIGANPTTGEYTGKKAKSQKEAAARAELGENSGERVNKALTALGLDSEWRRKFWADNSAAAEALSDQEAAENGVNPEEFEDNGLTVTGAPGGSGLYARQIENTDWFKKLPAVEKMNGPQAAYAFVRASSYEVDYENNGEVSNAILERVKTLIAEKKLSEAQIQAAYKKVNQENAAKAKGDAVEGSQTDAAEETDQTSDVDAELGGEEGVRVSDDAREDDAPVTAAAPAPAPKVVTKKKRTIVKPSKGKEARYAYLSAGALRRDLEGLFLGRGLGRKVVVVETFDDLADAMSPAELESVIAEELADPGAMQAFVANGRAFMIADRIGEDDGRAVFMHEVGAHLGLEKQLPTEAFNKLADLIKSWAKLTDLSKPMDRARNAVALRAVERLMAANTPKEQRNSELVAYFVEEAVMAGYNPTAVAEESVYGAAAQFIRRIVSAFKAALQKFGVDISKVTPRDIVDMAYGAAQIELYGNGAQKAFASAEAEAKFKAWFGKSTVVNEDGSPKIMYHGTARNVERFQPKQAGAIFLTDDPEFAEGFAQSSEFWMRANPQKWMEPDDFAKMLDEAEAKIRLRMERSGRLTGQASPGYANANADLETIQRAKRGEFRTSWPVEIDSLVGKALPSSQNIIPLYVKAEKPFDYMDQDSLRAVLKKVYEGVKDDTPITISPVAQEAQSLTDFQLFENIVGGDWRFIEAPEVQAAIRALGFDSFYVTENGRRNLAVYSAAQVKSAVGNKEFDPRDNRIHKSVRAAPRQAPEVPEHMTGTQPLPKVEQAIRSLPPVLRPGARKVAQLLRAAGRKVLNTAAFTDDLLDRAVSMGIKSAEKYKKLARERAASIGHQERMVLDAVTGFNELDASLKGKDGPVNQYLWKTTTREAWGFQPDWLTEQVAIDKEMKAAFDALPAPAQKVVKDMLRHGHETLKAKKQLVMDMMVSEYDALIAAETDPEAKKALEADKAKSVKSSYGSLMRLADNKPYAPIKRFGSHVVIAKSQAYIDAELNGDQKLMRDLESQEEHYYVDFVDGEIAASDLEENLKAKPDYAFTQYREIEEQRNDLYGGSKTLKAIGDLKAKIDGLPSSAERKELARMLQEMYLLQLGEDSARKSELRRRKIAGDIDMIRSFETQGLADARFMGQIQYGQPMLETMNDMRREVKDSKIGDANAKSEVFNELIKRHLQAMEYEPTPVINTLTRMSSMWFLATSPSYYLQNSTQPWMMSLPYMAAKHDYGKMAKLLSGAYGDVWGPLKDAKMFGQMDFKALLADENKSLTKGEKAMIRSLLDADRIDIGMANEIGQITAEVEARTAKGVYNKVDNSLRGLQQKLEAVNRLTSALAAYRAETSAGSSEAEATAYADDVIQRTHGDYSSWNAPRAFNTRGGKIMLQFRKYQLIQLTMMAKLFNNSFGEAKTPEEKAQKIVARKALRNMMAQAFVVGGGKALPAGGLIAYVFSKLFGEDDEPPETTFRKMVGNEDIADMLLYGSLAVAGINGAPYGGWGNSTSILPFADIDLTSRKGVSEAGYALLSGPFGGLTLRAADGIGYIQNGDYWRGIENLLPKGFTNFSKAIREGSEGATNKRGDQLLTPEEVSYWQGLQQSLGLTPLSSTKRMVASDQLYSTRTDVKAEGARIKKDFLTARRNGDSAEMAAARKEWADYQDKRVRLGFDRQSLSELMKAGDQQRTREKLTRGGVQYRKGEEGFAEQLAVDEE